MRHLKNENNSFNEQFLTMTLNLNTQIMESVDCTEIWKSIQVNEVDGVFS
jgi:hypothetical protein